MILQLSPQEGLQQTVDAVGNMSKLIDERSAMVVAMAILYRGVIVLFIHMIRANR